LEVVKEPPSPPLGAKENPILGGWGGTLIKNIKYMNKNIKCNILVVE